MPPAPSRSRPCPSSISFQPSADADKAEKAKAENGKKKSVGKRTAKAKPETGKKRVTKAKASVQKKRKNRKRVTIDTTTTASISAYPVEKAAPDKANADGGPRFERFVAQHASSNGVPVSLAHAVITVESNYRVNARGSAGEIGLMQIKPATARMMGYRGTTRGLYDPRDQHQVWHEVSRHGPQARRRRHMQDDPQIQCRPCREAHEPGVVGLLRQGEAPPWRLIEAVPAALVPGHAYFDCVLPVERL